MSVRLAGNGISEASAMTIAAAIQVRVFSSSLTVCLQKGRSLTSLDMADNNVDEQGAAAISVAFQARNATLDDHMSAQSTIYPHRLILSNNKIRAWSLAAALFSKVLLQCFVR